MKGWRPIAVYAAVCIAYVAAILERSSLGVASVDATTRFDVAAAVLSILSVAQVVVYAALQIPVGVFIDRVGPRVPLVLGAATMAAGQLLLALAPGFGWAVVGRILVGAGDAMTFTAGIRLITMWIAPNRAPIMVQVFAQIGQVGQLLSAFPLVWLLHGPGWAPAFISAAAVAVIGGLAVVVATATVGTPPYPVQLERMGFRQTVHHLGEALRRPGTQLGFWTHFTLQPSITMFTLLWGIPYLTVAVGLPAGTATALLGMTVLVSVVAGPVLGLLSARFPFRRSNLSLTIVGAIIVAWSVTLAWPGRPPLWLIIVLICVMTVGGPGSLIGFDYARTYNPARSHGSANGVVNGGGFLAAFTIMLLVGVVLDLVRNPGAPDGVASLYSLDSFRIAFLAQFPVLGLGIIMILVLRHRIRRGMRDDEGITVAPLWVAIIRRIRHGAPVAARTASESGVRY